MSKNLLLSSENSVKVRGENRNEILLPLGQSTPRMLDIKNKYSRIFICDFLFSVTLIHAWVCPTRAPHFNTRSRGLAGNEFELSALNVRGDQSRWAPPFFAVPTNRRVTYYQHWQRLLFAGLDK